MLISMSLLLYDVYGFEKFNLGDVIADASFDSEVHVGRNLLQAKKGLFFFNYYFVMLCFVGSITVSLICMLSVIAGS